PISPILRKDTECYVMGHQQRRNPKRGNPIGRPHKFRRVVNRRESDRNEQIVPMMLKTQTTGRAPADVRETKKIATKASRAESESPKAAGKANCGGKPG